MVQTIKYGWGGNYDYREAEYIIIKIRNQISPHLNI